MTGQRICACRWDGCPRDDLTPQGHKSHETHCDHNPNPGISYDDQQKLGLDDGPQAGGTPDGHPNPDQRADSSGGLPPVETLAGKKNPNESATQVATDGGTRSVPSSCPLCGADDVLDAGDAKSAYVDAVDRPNPKAVLGYELADYACNQPACAALWGEEYHEPLPMSEVVNA